MVPFSGRGTAALRLVNVVTSHYILAITITRWVDASLAGRPCSHEHARQWGVIYVQRECPTAARAKRLRICRWCIGGLGAGGVRESFIQQISLDLASLARVGLCAPKC